MLNVYMPFSKLLLPETQEFGNAFKKKQTKKTTKNYRLIVKHQNLNIDCIWMM